MPLVDLIETGAFAIGKTLGNLRNDCHNVELLTDTE